MLTLVWFFWLVIFPLLIITIRIISFFNFIIIHDLKCVINCSNICLNLFWIIELSITIQQCCKLSLLFKHLPHRRNTSIILTMMASLVCSVMWCCCWYALDVTNRPLCAVVSGLCGVFIMFMVALEEGWVRFWCYER